MSLYRDVIVFYMLLDKINNLDVELDKDSQIALEAFLTRVGEKISIATEETTADAQGTYTYRAGQYFNIIEYQDIKLFD